MFGSKPSLFEGEQLVWKGIFHVTDFLDTSSVFNAYYIMSALIKIQNHNSTLFLKCAGLDATRNGRL